MKSSWVLSEEERFRRYVILMRIVPILKNAQMSAIIFLRKIKLSSLRKIFPITMVYVSRERTIGYVMHFP